jgi:[protein-PII] uridylyltransferase
MRRTGRAFSRASPASSRTRWSGRRGGEIYTTQHGWALDCFQGSRTRDGEHYRDLIQMIEKGLADKVADTTPLGAPQSGRISRWVKHFPIEPAVQIVEGRRPGHWLVLLSCADRPGLLSSVSRVLLKHELNLIDARVNTLGARAEDAFVTSGAQLADAAKRESIAEELRSTAA